jgi:iron(III) transport system permease protein
MKLGPWRYLALLFCGLYFFLAVVLPLGALIAGSFMKFMTPNITPALFTLDNYREATQNREAAIGLRNTLVYGIVGATVIALFSSYLSYLVVRRRTRTTTLLGALAMLPASLPSLTLALGILWAYVRLAPWIYGTVWILLLAYLTRLTPYGLRVMSSSLVQIDPDLEHAARLSGSSQLGAFRRVTLPLIRPALFAAWTLLFTHVILEVSMTVLLYTSSTTTMAINVWFANFGGVTTLAYSLSVILAAVGFVMLVLSTRLQLASARALTGSA